MDQHIVISSGKTKLDHYLGLLPSGLAEHLVRAHKKAIELATLHDVDIEKAGLAALCHDIARNIKGDELHRLATRYGLQIHPLEDRHRVLLHGPVGAEILSDCFRINDGEILEAIRWHTTFNVDLGPIAKVTYLADKLDRNKAHRFSDMEGKHSLARKDMDRAILAFLEEEISSILDSGKEAHPAAIQGRNSLRDLLH
jgi:predicted HD superfamily hydrolase involved in NAD metabolism